MNRGNECITNNNDPYFPGHHDNCTILSMLDQQHIFYEIANMTGIPEYHVVNGWALMRLNPDIKARDLMAPDNVHPQERGMGVLAQDIFMKMSLSPEIKARIEKVNNGEDGDWDNAVRA
jgi:hypothetical protein